MAVDIRSTSNASCPTSAIAQFVKQQRWQMLKLLDRSCLLERQQILTLFAPATRFEEDKSDEKGRQPMTIDDEPEDEQNETLVNSLLAKISLSRRSDNRHFANRICNECLSLIYTKTG